ncbi:MAG: restriction endonuclease [Victivallales bacterium]|jgi:restriction system protein
MSKMPTFDSLMNPLLSALTALGGSGSIEEIYEKVVQTEKLPEDITSILHDKEKSNSTEVQYRLAWARTYLKKYGLLENSIRGIWALTSKAKGLENINSQEIVKTVREMDRNDKLVDKRGNKKVVDINQEESPDEAQEWRNKLHHILTKNLNPQAFERLIQRLLRESGFVQVEVTGRTGDGGIDGKGIAKIHGFMSFHVIFQCKKYQGSVGSGEIRDFRGAMVGRSDKGLFITTGTFSPAAIKEATRDGAPPIDLVDGEQLAEKLKEFKLGVTTELVENVSVNEKWFSEI